MRDDVRRTPRDSTGKEDNTARPLNASQPIRIFPGLWRTVSILLFLADWDCGFFFFLMCGGEDVLMWRNCAVLSERII